MQRSPRSHGNAETETHEDTDIETIETATTERLHLGIRRHLLGMCTHIATGDQHAETKADCHAQTADGYTHSACNQTKSRTQVSKTDSHVYAHTNADENSIDTCIAPETSISSASNRDPCGQL